MSSSREAKLLYSDNSVIFKFILGVEKEINKNIKDLLAGFSVFNLSEVGNSILSPKKESKTLEKFVRFAVMADYFEEMGWRPLENGEAPNHFLHFARLLRDFGMFEELGEDKKLPPPASKEFVKNLKREVLQETEYKCPVCLRMSDDEIMITLTCKHSFHSGCILPWLERTSTCPLCRHEMPTDDEDYEKYKKEKVRAKERENDLKTLHNSMFS